MVSLFIAGIVDLYPLLPIFWFPMLSCGYSFNTKVMVFCRFRPILKPELSNEEYLEKDLQVHKSYTHNTYSVVLHVKAGFSSRLNQHTILRSSLVQWDQGCAILHFTMGPNFECIFRAILM